MLRWRTYLWMLVLPFFLFSCNEQKQEAPSRYAISWFYPNNDYQHWVRTQDSSAQFIELYSQSYEDLDSILSTCNGLILTGGSDIAPDRFGALDSLAVCGKPNLRRDSVELKALEYVKRSGMPTLGVCRGMQMINVSFGGDLILDIPSTVGSHQHMQKGGDAHHVVYVTPSVRTPFGLDSAETNSNHHQAIATIGIRDSSRWLGPPTASWKRYTTQKRLLFRFFGGCNGIQNVWILMLRCLMTS